MADERGDIQTAGRKIGRAVMVVMLTLVIASVVWAGEPSMASRARALSILQAAGCQPTDANELASTLANADAIIALHDESGDGMVRAALGCGRDTAAAAQHTKRATSTRSDATSQTETETQVKHAAVPSTTYDAPSDTAPPQNSESPPADVAAKDTPAAKTTPAPPRENAQLFGTTVGSDYTAKHFSLITGATVLNRFKLSRIPDDQSMKAESFKLDNGSTAARAFVEGNIRYRWAWQDRLSPQQSAVQAALDMPEVQAAAARRDRARQIYADAAKNDTGAPATTKTKTTGDLATARRRRLDDAAQRLADADDADAEFREAFQKAYAATSADWHTQWARSSDAEVPATGILVCNRKRTCESWNPDRGAGKRCKEEEDMMDRTLTAAACYASYLIPADYEGRLGFVFNSGADTNGAGGVPGADDLYAELTVGWNLVRWSFPTGSWAETPIRGAFNFEPSLGLVSDTDVGDIHERYFIGLSSVIGVPIRWTKPATAPKTPTSQGATEGIKAPEADPVVEFIARVGATYVDVPVFKSSSDGSPTDLVKVRNGDEPRFHPEWGLGVDLELNVPVPNNLGYVIARGTFSAELNPDPWAMQLGYTIPISNLISGLGAHTPATTE